MASISERESREIEAANASGNTPVVFIHGLWLLPSSWANWADLFKQAGYAPLTPDWPDDPETVEGARAEPEVVAKKTLEEVAEHTTEIIKCLGHETSGDQPLARLPQPTPLRLSYQASRLPARPPQYQPLHQACRHRLPRRRELSISRS